MEGIVELLKAIGQIMWPLLAVYVVIRFAPEVKKLISSAREREFTLELGGAGTDHGGDQQALR